MAKVVNQDNRIQDLEKQILEGLTAKEQRPSVKVRSYSEALHNQTGNVEQHWKEEPKTFNIIIKAKKIQSPEYMKTLIKTKVNPTEMKVGVNNFKPQM